jgi:hypothetical protein
VVAGQAPEGRHAGEEKREGHHFLGQVGQLEHDQLDDDVEAGALLVG